ncbi:MAG: gas vesicle protein [Chloroflexota bacterium]
MLFKLLTAPVTLPVSGLRFILQQLLEMAERELLDEARIRDELILLQLRLEEGEIAEDEYAAAEAALIERWRAARAAREG